MSWSFSIESAVGAPEETLRESLQAAWESAPKQSDAPEAEVSEQVDAAIEAAVALARTVHPARETCCDVAGEACCTVTVSAGGHANPDHAPAAGYVNDTVYVSVSTP